MTDSDGITPDEMGLPEIIALGKLEQLRLRLAGQREPEHLQLMIDHPETWKELKTQAPTSTAYAEEPQRGTQRVDADQLNSLISQIKNNLNELETAQKDAEQYLETLQSASKDMSPETEIGSLFAQVIEEKEEGVSQGYAAISKLREDLGALMDKASAEKFSGIIQRLRAQGLTHSGHDDDSWTKPATSIDDISQPEKTHKEPDT